jgi:hypothetical protein
MRPPATAIPIPPRLQSRPRWRGLPVPFIALIRADGVPDFRVTDENVRWDVIQHRQCQLCGERLGGTIFFVGGPRAAEALQYFEPAAHLDCVMYAMQVCPFIAGRMEHAEISDVQADNPSIRVHVDDSYDTVKTEEWVIVKARDYSKLITPGNTLLLRPERITTRTAPLRPDTMGPEEWAAVRRTLADA